VAASACVVLRQPPPECCCPLLRNPPLGKELASTLSFLLQLSFRRVWQPYALAQLSAQEQDIAAHMAQLGLVHTFSQVGALTALLQQLQGWCLRGCLPAARMQQHACNNTHATTRMQQHACNNTFILL
jgi:hypothetical protein